MAFLVDKLPLLTIGGIVLAGPAAMVASTTPRTLSLVLTLFGPVLGVAVLAKAVFVARNPAFAAEYDVRPKSKHTSAAVESPAHAKETARDGCFKAVLLFGLGIAVYAWAPSW